MAILTKNTDADTFGVSGEINGEDRDIDLRLQGINTAESVAVNESRNTEAGEESSRRAKVIAPKGADVRVETEGKKDKFGSRVLGDLKLQTAQGEVDYALVAAHQGMTAYSVKYGRHPNPDQDNILKEFYSKDRPLQYAESKEPLSPKEYAEVGKALAAYPQAEKDYDAGDISREEYEKVMYNAYGDGLKVARYMYQNNNFQKEFDLEEYDDSEKMAFAWAAQSKENRDSYDSAMRSSHTGGAKNPETEPSFWDSLVSNLETGFSSLNDLAVIGRRVELSNARTYGKGALELSDEELRRDVPVEWQDKVMQEAEKYGDASAEAFKRNLLTDLADEEAMAEMPLMTQLAVAVPALLTSPLTLIPGVKMSQGAVAVSKTISQVMGRGALRGLAVPAKVASYAAFGVVEAGISAIPRTTKETFTSEQMKTEMLWGAGAGVLLPAVLKGVSVGRKRVNAHNVKMNEIQRKLQVEQEARVDAYQQQRDIQQDTSISKQATEIKTTGQQLEDIISNPKETFAYKQTILKKYHDVEVDTEEEMLELLTDIGSVKAANAEGALAAEIPDEQGMSKLLADVAEATKIPAKAGEPGIVMKRPTVLTTEELNYLDNVAEGIPQTPKPKEVVDDLVDTRNTARKEMEIAADARVDEVLKRTPLPYGRGKTSAAVDAATGTLTKSLTQTMLESESRVSKFVGSELLELPEGMGGKVIRRPTASLQQDSLRTRYLTQTQPSYHKLVGQYAGEKGKRYYGKSMARHTDSQTNQMVKEFSRDIATVLEQLRQGVKVTVKSPAVLQMVEELESSMGKMFDDLVDAGVVGFKKERRIKHYFPQLWNEGSVRGAMSTHGRSNVQRLLAKGYISSKHNAITSQAEAMSAAANFLKKVDEQSLPDGALPATMDSRAKARLDIDTTVKDENGLSIMDLMDQDFSTVTAKYANRAAGQVALANKGLKSDLDIASLRKRMEQEGTGNLQHFDDALNLVMGRPTRDGLDPGLNAIKDAISLSKMGGLGMAQAAEAGTELSRALMMMYKDPKVFSKLMGMSMETKQGKQLMKEVQALAGISNEVHLLDRQASHLDTSKTAGINSVRGVAQWIAGKASFGKYKAPAGYILAQGSGFNVIRRFERRIANASFMLDTAKHFKDGTGAMSKERMRDIGLDPDSAALHKIFKDIVEYDENGIVKKLNIDKWDKSVREDYHLAMYRDDAQMVQRPLAGEEAAWLNQPAVALVAQFKKSALLANKKQLTRGMQFADQEAALGLMLNTAMAYMTRTAKFATLGAAAYAVTGNEEELVNPQELDYLDPEKYIQPLGFFPDMGHIGAGIYQAFDEDRMQADSALGTVVNGVSGEVPAAGWMKDYYDLAGGIKDRDANKGADAVKSLTILGNMQFMDTIYKGLESLNED